MCVALHSWDRRAVCGRPFVRAAVGRPRPGENAWHRGAYAVAGGASWLTLSPEVATCDACRAGAVCRARHVGRRGRVRPLCGRGSSGRRVSASPARVTCAVCVAMGGAL